MPFGEAPNGTVSFGLNAVLSPNMNTEICLQPAVKDDYVGLNTGVPGIKSTQMPMHLW